MKTIIAVIFLTLFIVVSFTAIDIGKTVVLTKISPISVSIDDVSYSEDVKISVSISGCVKKAGTYTLYQGDTLEDLLEKAGGETDEADAYCYDTYLFLEDGMSLYIPFNTDYEKISINEATLEELKTLNRVGDVIAQRIIDYRETNGSFSYLEELKKVSGFGTALFEKVKDYICL